MNPSDALAQAAAYALIVLAIILIRAGLTWFCKPRN
jgi:hypothetical protein